MIPVEDQEAVEAAPAGAQAEVEGLIEAFDELSEGALEGLRAGEYTKTFVIDKPELVEWWLRKITLIDAEVAAVQANAKSIIEGLAREREGLIRAFEADVDQVARACVYDQMNLKKDKATGQMVPRKKTFKTLYGTFGLRSVSEGFTIADKDTLIAKAQALAPHLVKKVITESLELDLDGFKAVALKTLRDDGEVIEGFNYVAPGEKVAWKATKTGAGEA